MDIGDIAFAEEHAISTWMPTRTGHGLVHVYVPPGSYQVPTYHCLGLGSRTPCGPTYVHPFLVDCTSPCLVPLLSPLPWAGESIRGSFARWDYDALRYSRVRTVPRLAPLPRAWVLGLVLQSARNGGRQYYDALLTFFNAD